MAAAESAAGGARRTRQREWRTAPEDPAGPGLNRVRHDLEHKPAARDPFAVDKERAADALGIRWAARYRIKPCKGGYEAVRRHGPAVTLTASTPDDLDRAMAEDSAGGTR